jgi:hypothetical protein
MTTNFSHRNPIGNFSSNLERNELLYWYWRKRKKIVETAQRTGIPKSSVEYYFHKFDKYAMKGRAVPIGDGEQIERLEEVLARGEALRKGQLKRVVDRLESEGKFDEALKFVEFAKAKKTMGLDLDPIAENLKEQLDISSRTMIENTEQLRVMRDLNLDQQRVETLQQQAFREAWNSIMKAQGFNGRKKNDAPG